MSHVHTLSSQWNVTVCIFRASKVIHYSLVPVPKSYRTLILCLLTVWHCIDLLFDSAKWGSDIMTLTHQTDLTLKRKGIPVSHMYLDELLCGVGEHLSAIKHAFYQIWLCSICGNRHLLYCVPTWAGLCLLYSGQHTTEATVSCCGLKH